MAVAKNRKEKQRIKIHIRRCMYKLGPDVAQPVVGIYYTCVHCVHRSLMYSVDVFVALYLTGTVTLVWFGKKVVSILQLNFRYR